MLSKTKTQGGVKSVTAIYIQGMKGGMVEVASTTYVDIIEEFTESVIFTPIFTPKW